VDGACREGMARAVMRPDGPPGTVSPTQTTVPYRVLNSRGPFYRKLKQSYETLRAGDALTLTFESTTMPNSTEFWPGRRRRVPGLLPGVGGRPLSRRGEHGLRTRGLSAPQ
jgi:hypothetical protein